MASNPWQQQWLVVSGQWLVVTKAGEQQASEQQASRNDQLSNDSSQVCSNRLGVGLPT